MTAPELNPEGIEAAAKALYDEAPWPKSSHSTEGYQWDELTDDIRQTFRDETQTAVSAYLAALPAPRTITTVEEFINQRPEYITALQNTRGTDDQADYHRWQGGAEARRQLAQVLGWTVPHNPGETTKPEGGGE